MMVRRFATALCMLLVSLTHAEEKPVPVAFDTAQISEISVEPTSVELTHARARQRILVTGKLGDRLVDLTAQAKFASSESSIVLINEFQEAIPQTDGTAQIKVDVGHHTLNVPVTVTNAQTPRPISFMNEIEPVLSKMSCNSGGCHGKSGGQNGFRLSLLGYQPRADYESIVKEARGRRLTPAAAEESLLLRKAVGQLPHGGGKKLHPEDASYQLIADWIRQGSPYSESDPKVDRITVSPPQRILGKDGRQSLRVTATYTDGRTEDVTRQVLFQTNDEAVATVDALGNVSTQKQSGEAAVMARYMGQVAVFRATVPVGAPLPEKQEFAAINEIDRLASKKWTDLGLVPSRKTSDPEFIRRVYFDVCGKLPPKNEVEKFIASTDPQKRETLVDQLLSSADYASHMAMKWGAVLQNKRSGRADFAPGTHAMALWLKDAFNRDMPYDDFVRAIITATGTPVTNPPVVWYRQVRTPQQNVDNVSQLFLGTRIQCAQCHHHPFEKWGQDDYYSMAAYFTRIGRKAFENSETGEPTEAVFVTRGGGIENPATRKPATPAGLGAPPTEIPPGEDPRADLVDWMTAPDNPFFSRALVNRIWGHFFNRGIVEPVDDMRVTNPPTNPELIDWLARDFQDHKYSIKHLIKTILLSATYQLASEPNEHNRHDAQNFARYYPKRLPAEVLLDAIDQATLVRSNFSFPEEMRTVDLPDENVGSYFLDIFGRPQRQSSCECERTDDANLSQALHLLNSQEIQGKLSADQGRAAQLAADSRPDDQKIRELYLTLFSREPTESELKVATGYVSSKEDRRAAYQNLLWALLNTKEFQFNI